MKLWRGIIPSIALAGALCFPDLAFPADGAGQSVGEKGAAAPGAAALGADPLIENLAGQDADKGALAARDLLREAVEDRSGKRLTYLEFLCEALDPAALARGSATPAVAERLLAALDYTASSGQPYPPEGAELVLKLLGRAPESLRKVVHEAIESFARAERPTGNSRIVAALGKTIQEEERLTPAHLEEVAGVLWRIDGKELLRSLIQGLTRKKGLSGPDLAPYLLALRGRLGFSFTTIEEWERWWTENQDKSIEVILEAAHRQFRTRHAELWRKTFRRLESAGDPEAYLGAAADVIESDPTSELRGAAVEALGALPQWLQDGKLSTERAGAVEDARRAALTSRGLEILLRLLRDEWQGPRVRRKTLAALRSYAVHLGRSPGEAAEVASALASRLQAAVRPSGAPVPGPTAGLVPVGTPREDLLELVRTAGALRVGAARPSLEAILAEALRGRPDTELATASVEALGKVLELGVRRESVELILECYRTRDLPEKEARDLRKACASALNLRIEDAALRAEVRRFYGQVLSAEDKSGRVPAIVGLGILAKGGDREAVAELGRVLERRGQFEPSEVAAAIDALAYLGGREAIQELLPHLPLEGRGAADTAFLDHVWRKVVGLVKAQGLELLRWTLVNLETRALRIDQPEGLALVLKLTEEPDLAPLLAPDRAGAALPEALVAFWEVMMVRVRALECGGNEAAAEEVLKSLADLLIKNARLKAARAGAEDELAQARARLARYARAAAQLKDPLPPPDALADDLLAAIPPGETPVARWRGLAWLLEKAKGLPPSPDGARVVEALLRGLTTGDAATPQSARWQGLDPHVRARCEKSLVLLRDRLRSAAPPPPPPAGQ